ncbi:hypothetical protein ACQKF6_15000 [Bacillus velezensis]
MGINQKRGRVAGVFKRKLLLSEAIEIILSEKRSGELREVINKKIARFLIL